MNYPFAIGRIRALENRIFDRNKFNKLIKTDRSEFIDALIELGYGHSKSKDLEILINDELELVKALFDEIAPERKYTDLFFLENDALNIKFLYKNKIFGTDFNEYISNLGIIDEDALRKAIFDKDVSNLEKKLQTLFIEIDEAVRDKDNPRAVSSAIDKLIYEFIIKSLRRKKSLQRYFKLRIDFTNILTFIRSRKLDWDQDEFLEMYINGGKISKDEFISLYDKNHDEVLKALSKYEYGKINKGLKAYFDHLNINQLEQFFDSLILELMFEFKYDAFNIGPMIYYFLEKQAEAKNIRLIYATEDIEITNLLEY